MQDKCDKIGCIGTLGLISVDKKFVVFTCTECDKPYVYRRIVR